MSKLKIAALFAGLCLSLVASPVGAQGVWNACDDGSAGSSTICADAGEGTEAADIVKRLINVFLYVIGALSVIMIVHSGFKYVTSRGDAEGVKSAKNTLLYAVIGLIVAMLAFAIVNFVIGAFSPTASSEAQSTANIGNNVG